MSARGRRTPGGWLGVSVALAAGAVLLAILVAWGYGAGETSGAPAPRPMEPAAAAQLPGAPPLEPDLIERLRDAWGARPAGYAPRTRHLNPDGTPRYTNRLFLETSPYLIQHAHNPVNWYPWGDGAFETARRLGRPVLLSVGYSTCHWCHVMEEESFDDEEIARYLNESYIAIKVDREERPDVDAIYMNAVVNLTGRGGWPMTVWLTPDRKPFYGGTYFPARDGDRGARVGFLTLLRRMKEIYDTEPDRVIEAAAEIARTTQGQLSPGAPGELPGPDVIVSAASFYRQRFDAEHGGTKGAPKFPSNLPVRFLLRHWRRTGDADSLRMAVLTLERMAAGGIHDHVGGGFHRYSTDPRWLVPHFEKMLYDNALLAAAYLEGYQATGREEFAAVVRAILRYVERDMTAAGGGFYSATDADSLTPEGRREEGYFFTWTPQEIEEALGPERARVAKAYFAVTAGGNFEGRNILHAPRPLADVAKELGLPAEKAQAAVEESKEILYRARFKRPAPLRDEKILTAWNGLMISAFAQASLVLGEPRYAERASGAARFVLQNLRRDGRLLRSWKDGRARHAGYLDDYAFLAAGLLDLYEATGEIRWLREALALDMILARHHEEHDNGGFFMTADDHEALLAREKPAYDGAEPSGNSVHLLNLLRLGEYTTEDRYRQRAERAMRAFGGVLASRPAALSEMLLAVDFRLDTPKEIVIVTANGRRDAEPLLARLRRTFLPNRILVVAGEGEDLQTQSKLVPLLVQKVARGRKATAYVCERGVCELPTSDPGVFAKQIAGVVPLKAAPGVSQPASRL